MRFIRIFLILFLVGIIFIAGCNKKCDSGLYTSDGKCCTYVCDKDCQQGYKEGTCNCECLQSSAATNPNIDDIFDNSDSVQPPQIPT